MFCEREGVEAIGAGTNADAPTPVSGDLIEWADVVFVMEPVHRNRLSRKYSTLLRGKPLVVLGIPDNYDYMAPELIRLLEAKTAPFLARWNLARR